MQINLLTNLGKSYTLGRWLGMVVYVTLEIIRVGPPQKAWALTHKLKKKKLGPKQKLGPISLTDWNFFEKGSVA